MTDPTYCKRCRRHHTTVPLEDVRPLAERLIWDGLARGGRRFDDRYGLRDGSGERLLLRILHGHVKGVRTETADRLETLLRGA